MNLAGTGKMLSCTSLSRKSLSLQGAHFGIVPRRLVRSFNCSMGNSNSQEQRHQVDAPFIQPEEQGSSLAVQGCIFCDIIHDNMEKSPLIFQVRKRSGGKPPRSTCELIRARYPQDIHINTVREMHATGQRLLQELRPNHTYMMGYHLPPFTSINHLHLHCFALPFKHWTKQVKYILPCVWMSAEDFERQLSEAASKNSP